MCTGRIQPVPSPDRVLQTAAPHRPGGVAGSTPCRFMVGVAIKPPWRQDQVTRLQMLLQPAFQALFVRADRAVGDTQVKYGTGRDAEFAKGRGKLRPPCRPQAPWRPPRLARIACFAVGHGNDAHLHALPHCVMEQSATAEDLVVRVRRDQSSSNSAGRGSP